MYGQTRSWGGVLGAGLLGAALALAIGANQPKSPAVPKYSTQFFGPFLHVVDNDTNRMYIYQNDEKSSKLLGVVDLNETGKPEIKATKPEAAKKD